MIWVRKLVFVVCVLAAETGKVFFDHQREHSISNAVIPIQSDLVPCRPPLGFFTRNDHSYLLWPVAHCHFPLLQRVLQGIRQSRVIFWSELNRLFNATGLH